MAIVHVSHSSLPCAQKIHAESVYIWKRRG